MKIYKACKCCGREFRTEDIFVASTKLVGIQSFAPYNLLSLELRDCLCGTTLARKLSVCDNSSLILVAA
ncbi:MAG: hypothetical protein H7263_09365 [Candidatus Sericytochromatia bacterium]|nr:hypothetical protein [Candidatus Sericytochromatia bacterium]